MSMEHCEHVILKATFGRPLILTLYSRANGWENSLSHSVFIE